MMCVGRVGEIPVVSVSQGGGGGGGGHQVIVFKYYTESREPECLAPVKKEGAGALTLAVRALMSL